MATFTISGHDQVRNDYQGGTGLLLPTFPEVGTTGKLTPGGTTGSVAIPAQSSVGGSGVYRMATDTALHFKFGTSEVEATTSDPLMNIGTEFVIISDATVTHVAVITAA